MKVETKFESALKAAEPLTELRSVVRELLADGHAREELSDDLERLRVELRGVGRDDEEDVVLEVMDFLVGWCSPQMKL